MILDAQLRLSNEQDVSQVVGTYVSTNVIDLGVAGSPVVGTLMKDYARGAAGPYFWAQMIELLSTGSSPTIEVQVVQADDTGLSSNAQVLMTTGAIAAATAAAGYVFRLGKLSHGLTKRYLGMKYVIAVATTTTGTISSGLVWGVQADWSA